jgi:mono/diheme cytochrome c family protein/glucose/arabinose dehydrogenase
MFRHRPSHAFLSLSFTLGLSLLLPVLTRAQNGDHTNEVQVERVPKDRIPATPVRSADEEAKTFALAPGFRVELVAAEPLVRSPVTMQFDHRGRLWVVEMTGYMRDPDGTGEDRPIGSIAVLEDTDGDGRMDRRTVFADGLVMPRGIMLFQDGALVAEPPKLWFLRDTDGDGKADKKELVADDYASQDDPKLGRKANPEHASNSPTWMLDNWIYSANHTWRYRWNASGTNTWIKEPTAFRGQWGLSQDNYGRLYHNSNSDQLRADLVDGRYLTRNPNLRNPFGVNVQLAEDQRVWTARVNPGVNRGYQPGQLTADGRLATYTGACGPVVYRGDQFGPEFVGDVFLCEPTGNMIRRNKILNRDGFLSATNAYFQAEFMTSQDERFRPVNLFNGPDGALYIVDLYRGLIQHHIYLTTYLRKQIESRNLQSPVNLGRIWRVVKEGNAVKRDVLPARVESAELVKRLSHPNGFWRDRAQQMLIERKAVDAVPSLVQSLDAGKNPEALGRLHALWTLEGLGSLQLSHLDRAMDDSSPVVRRAGMKLAEGFLKGEDRDDARSLILKNAGLLPAEEQLQLIFTLGEIGTPATDAILRVLMMTGPVNRLRVDAVLSGVGGRELEFLDALILDPACAQMRDTHRLLLSGLSRCVAVEGLSARIQHLLDLIASRPAGDWQQVALLEGISSTLPAARAGQPAPRIKPVVFASEPVAWKTLVAVESEEVKKRVASIDRMIAWPGKPGMHEIKIAAPLQGDDLASFNRGKELYTTICGACHQPHGNGQEGLAPPLRDSEWVLGSEQRLIRIVLHGVRDELTVKGQKYTLNMPALAEALNDQQIADALTYIRREWDHPGAPVKAATVQSIRKATQAREDSWTQPELLRIP